MKLAYNVNAKPRDIGYGKVILFAFQQLLAILAATCLQAAASAHDSPQSVHFAFAGISLPGIAGLGGSAAPDPFPGRRGRTDDGILSHSGEKHKEYEGRTVRVLVDGETGRDEYNLSSRTNGGRLVHLRGDRSLIGQFINVRITASNTWALYGELENG